MHHSHDNYYNDGRVLAGQRAQQQDHWMRFDSRTNQFVITLENDEGEECEHFAPSKFEVCPTCEGRGTHVNPSIDCDGLTGADFAEDPDFAESYFEGHYDVQCYECGGQRVVPTIDEDRTDPELLKRVQDQQEADHQYRVQRNYEMRMGY